MEKTQFLELARKRYSTRNFKEIPVEREKINLCLEAARIAPSACNSQPWEFIIIDDLQLKNKFCDAVFSGIFSTNYFVKKAPVVVAVISQKGNWTARLGNFLRDTRYYLIDIGISVEHFILQATELGLGTCWIGWFNEEEAKKFLSISGDKKVEILIALGYPADEPRNKKRKSLEEISKYNI